MIRVTIEHPTSYNKEHYYISIEGSASKCTTIEDAFRMQRALVRMFEDEVEINVIINRKMGIK